MQIFTSCFSLYSLCMKISGSTDRQTVKFKSSDQTPQNLDKVKCENDKNAEKIKHEGNSCKADG